MKNLLLSLALVLHSSFCLASISIVSDLDDTIKITSSNGDITGVTRDDVFTGIPEFFLGADLYSNELHVLSASPSILRPKIVHTLNKNNIKFTSLILRNVVTHPHKIEYKVGEIKKLMGTNSDDFILLGDDMGKDPESYAEVQKNFPTRILAAYIHVVNARSLPKGMQPYWTTFDLFLREHLQGRMSASWLTVAFEKLLNETRMNFIFPKKAQCPTDAVVWEWQTQTVFTVQAQQLIQKFNQHCQQRQSGKILL